MKAITLKSFMTGKYSVQKTSLIDSLNNFFDKDDHIDGIDDSHIDDDGE